MCSLPEECVFDNQTMQLAKVSLRHHKNRFLQLKGFRKKGHRRKTVLNLVRVMVGEYEKELETKIKR